MTTDTLALPNMTGLAPLHPTLPHTIVYSKPSCPSCDRAKARLFRMGMPAIDIDMTETTEVMDQFAGQLGVTSTPVVLVHNVFDRPVFFWSPAGVALDQIKYSTRACGERLAHMEAAGAFEPDSDADAYITELLDVAQTNDKVSPALTVHQFIELSARHIAPIRLQPGRIELGTSNQMGTARDQVPPVLRS